MKPSRLLIIGIVLTAVLSFALVLFSPSATKAQVAPPPPPGQPPTQRIVGAYAEQSDSEQITETFTTLILHADRTFTLVEASARQHKTFVGTWQQVDALTVEGTVIGADVSVTEPVGMDQPPLEVTERSYMIVFQSNTYEAATVTGTAGAADSFAVQRIPVATPPEQPPTPPGQPPTPPGQPPTPPGQPPTPPGQPPTPPQ